MIFLASNLSPFLPNIHLVPIIDVQLEPDVHDATTIPNNAPAIANLPPLNILCPRDGLNTFLN